MPTLQQIRPSISELPYEQALALILHIRTSRRTRKINPEVEAKKERARTNTAVNVRARTKKKLSASELAELTAFLQTLEGELEK